VPHVFLLHVSDSSEDTYFIYLLSIDLADVIWAWHAIFDHFHCDWSKDFELSATLSLILVLGATKGPEVASLGKALASIALGLEKTSRIVGELYKRLLSLKLCQTYHFLN